MEKELENKNEYALKFNKTTVIIFIVLAIIIYGNYTSKSSDKSVSESSNESVQTTMLDVQNKMNKECPFMVDKDLRIDNSIYFSDSNTFQTNYTFVNLEVENTDVVALKEYLLEQRINFVKTSPSMDIFKDKNVILACRFLDKNGKFMVMTSISPNEYKKTE